MNNLLIGIVILLKIVIPGLMLKFPFAGLWGNYFLDVVDGDVLRFLGLPEFSYQSIDKLCDLVSYFFMLGLGLRLKVRKLVIILFIYRLIGQLLFFATRTEAVFFYFQNLLEPFLMIYTLLWLIKKNESLAFITYKKYIVLVWIIVIAYKVWNEWYLHIANIDLSTIFFGFNGGS